MYASMPIYKQGYRLWFHFKYTSEPCRRAFCPFKPIGIYRNATRLQPASRVLVMRRRLLRIGNVQNLLLYYNLKSINDSSLTSTGVDMNPREGSYIDFSRASLIHFNLLHHAPYLR